MKVYLFVFLEIFVLTQLVSQSFWFGAKGGGSYLNQSWGDGFGTGSIRNPGFSGAGDLFIESYDEESKGSLYASAGYHMRGSSLRFVSFNNSFNSQQTFLFRNLVAEVGARKPFNIGKEIEPYFTVGIRGEYTLSTNLASYEGFNSLFFPNNAFVRKWLYGFSIGGGFESKFNEFIKYFVDFQLQPDVAFQYFQPPLFNVRDPFSQAGLINTPLRQVRNVTLELKVGIKFLRKVIYE